MVAMAQRLGMSVVAEGVEEEGQLDRLREWGCDTFQGFLFSPPLSADDLGGLLQAQEERA
jgi:EAL domain-containing protein (putative c-di-GMP-specific phosphodiesterase class I)